MSYVNSPCVECGGTGWHHSSCSKLLRDKQPTFALPYYPQTTPSPDRFTPITKFLPISDVKPACIRKGCTHKLPGEPRQLSFDRAMFEPVTVHICDTCWETVKHRKMFGGSDAPMVQP